ncbi:alpha/beta hydrolase [Streptosporangium sp. NBC_01756]|uniref:alpha/beta hydrolase n=1 Tax=Streptosporangium sp. NBC_01756 TaxID=2975950 RepID=UPI002DD97C88|nr:hypothetical protein [Streptosporangium sp. NBC_01756]WSC86595.1 hypothetical protein OIE48_40690 [Streptosporangium sp. NBC_01756]
MTSEIAGSGPSQEPGSASAISIDHTYENVATTFPDGRVTTCVTCEINKNPAWWEKLAKGRAADVSFVLDQLTGSHPKWKGTRLIDPSRIAMAGHSAGGASTIPTMVNDSRVRAGIDLDGTTDAPRSRAAGCLGRSCSWASPPRTPLEAGKPPPPGSATGSS